MNPNNPGGDPSYQGNPTPGGSGNPPSYPQQPVAPTQPGYGQQPPPYQPPAYNQAPTPPYGQPQYPQQPPGYPQQPPQKKSNKGWIIGCSIAAAVFLLLCGGIGVALYIGAQRAADTVKSAGQGTLAAAQVALFCSAVESQDYSSAYQLLSTAEQGRVGTPDQFAQHEASLDDSAGTVSSCQTPSNSPIASVSSDGKSATLHLEVERSNQAGTVRGDVRLVLENDSWVIDGADSSLKLL